MHSQDANWYRVYKWRIQSPEKRHQKVIAGIAQLVEQLICNQQVVGSSPSAGCSSAALSHNCARVALATGLPGAEQQRIGNVRAVPAFAS